MVNRRRSHAGRRPASLGYRAVVAAAFLGALSAATVGCQDDPPRGVRTAPSTAASAATATPSGSSSAAAAGSSTPRLEPAEVTAFVGATVIDGTGRPPLRHAVVVLERDEIKEVGPLASVDIPDGARTIQATGKWIVPGLVDAHVHFFQSGGLYTRPDVVDLRRIRPYPAELEAIKSGLDDTFRRYLASGVTAVVDVGGPFWNFEIRARARHAVMAPRVAVSGPLISTVSRPELDLGDPPIIEAKSPEQARELVQQQLAKKPDLIKLWYIVTPKRDPGEVEGIMRAAIDEAHRASVRVAVHATELATARTAVEAGADILVHSVDDEPVDDALLGLLKQRGTLYIPTLAVYEGYADVLGQRVRLSDIERRHGDPAAIASWADFSVVPSATPDKVLAKRRAMLRQRMPIQRKNLAKVYKAGITIAAGTDAGNIGTLHGASLHRELELMNEAGMSPGAVLVAATRNAARVFAKEPSFGTVEAGKRADLLVLRSDPLIDVGHLARIHQVVKGGVVLAPETIRAANPAHVVESQVAAYNARDLEGFLAYFADDAALVREPAGTEVARGRVALRAIYGKLFEENPDLHAEILQRITLGSTVVDEELVTGIKLRPYLRGVARYEVRGGRIVRLAVRTAP